MGLAGWDKLVRMTNKYPKRVKKQVYFHNMNRFDGIFLLKLIGLLLDNKSIKPKDVSFYI